jgi:hypothetical protein
MKSRGSFDTKEGRNDTRRIYSSFCDFYLSLGYASLTRSQRYGTLWGSKHQPKRNDQFIPNTYIHLSIPFPFFSQQDFATPSKKPAQAILPTRMKTHSRNLLNQLPTHPITLHTIRKDTPNRSLQPLLRDTNPIPIFIADPAYEKWVWFLFQIGCLVSADVVHDIAASVGFRRLFFEELVDCFHLCLS